ncbi:MAG: peptidylprolyl isomerase [Proteobacteria bacterium]|nr:peptidylprolyl isomerase [Pseudomonadota bacterium]
MPLRRLLLLGLLALAWPLPGSWGEGRAQEVQRIAAIVNDDVITVHDLSARIDLTILSSNLADSRDVRQRLAPRVLNALIEERLQMQEARRLTVVVIDSEIQTAIRRIEQANNLPPGRLMVMLQRAGIDQKALIDQLRAGIAWNKVVDKQVRPKVQIGSDEVDEVLNRIKGKAGRQEYLVAEILLAVDSPGQEDEVVQLAQRLIDHLRGGASFSALAQQFSQGVTASVGGDLGWVQKGQLSERLDAALDRLQEGQISPPVRDLGGVHILYLRDKRQVRAAGETEAVLDIRQVVLPFPRNADRATIQSRLAIARQARQTAKSCADMERLAGELNSPPPHLLEGIRLADLPPQIREVVGPLAIGAPSPPIQADDAVLLMMVCARSERDALPGRPDVLRSLERDQIELRARRYLRDLNRAAYIDIRV